MNQDKISRFLIVFILLVVFSGGAILGYCLIASKHMPNIPRIENTVDKDAPAFAAIFLLPMFLGTYLFECFFFVFLWSLGLSISLACGIGALLIIWLLCYVIH